MSMLMYSMAVMPLIKSIRCKKKYLQCWYADESACAGKLSHIHSSSSSVLQLGPAYGYFAEPTNSFLVVTKQYAEEAKELFKLRSWCDCCIRPSLPWWGDCMG